MDKNQIKRVSRDLTAEEQLRLRKQRVLIEDELPDLIAADKFRREARDEPTLSGQLRRAIHASELTLHEIAGQVGLTVLILDEFLTGERTLRSDTLDRLACALGLELAKVQ